MQLILDSAILETILERAATASRLVGHIDERAAIAVIGPLADSIDEVVHVLSELLGNPHVVVTVPSARSSSVSEIAAQDHVAYRDTSELVVLGEVP
jgi:hypothetical protein